MIRGRQEESETDLTLIIVLAFVVAAVLISIIFFCIARSCQKKQKKIDDNVVLTLIPTGPTNGNGKVKV